MVKIVWYRWEKKKLKGRTNVTTVYMEKPVHSTQINKKERCSR